MSNRTKAPGSGRVASAATLELRASISELLTKSPGLIRSEIINITSLEYPETDRMRIGYAIKDLICTNQIRKEKVAGSYSKYYSGDSVETQHITLTPQSQWPKLQLKPCSPMEWFVHQIEAAL